MTSSKNSRCDNGRAEPSGSGSYPNVRIRSNDLVLIDGRPHLAQQKQLGQWLLIDADTREAKLEAESDLVRLLGDGRLSVRSRPRKREPLSPLSEMAMDPLVESEAKRKHAYVMHVLDRPDGFRNSKPWVKKKIPEVAQRIGDKNPPCPGSVLNWVSRHQDYFNEIGLAAYVPRHDCKGSRGSKLHPEQEKALEKAVARYMQAGTMKDAHLEAEAHIREFNASADGRRACKTIDSAHLDRSGKLACPSLPTAYRRKREVSPFALDASRQGWNVARRKHQGYQTRSLPERPYAELEADATPLDILVVDQRGACLGRPYLIAFIDRATRMVVGYSITLDELSYAAVMEALRHTIYRKQISHIDGLSDDDWPCFGRPEEIFFDNGKEFLNRALQASSPQLGFKITRLPPREPWLKGLVEGFMGQVANLVHAFPGTTKSSWLELKDYENIDHPIFTLKELDALFTKWLVTDRHRSPNRNLGTVPGVGRAPIDALHDKVNELDVAELPDPTLFVALAGEVAHRTVQKTGITWDHIIYWSTDLDAVLAHPDHRERSGRNGPAQYRVRRDPYDLSKVYLVNHHSDSIITVPACDRWREYTQDLTAYQHRCAREHAKVVEGQRFDPEALSRAKHELRQAAIGVLRSGIRKKTERRVARYLHNRKQMAFESALADAEHERAIEEAMPLRVVESPRHVGVEDEAERDGNTSADGDASSGRAALLLPPADQSEDDLDEILIAAAKIRSESEKNA